MSLFGDKWIQIKWHDREFVGRDEYTTYSGFTSEDECREYAKDFKDKGYMYFPDFVRAFEQNEKWFCVIKTAR